MTTALLGPPCYRLFPTPVLTGVPSSGDASRVGGSGSVLLRRAVVGVVNGGGPEDPRHLVRKGDGSFVMPELSFSTEGPAA